MLERLAVQQFRKVKQVNCIRTDVHLIPRDVKNQSSIAKERFVKNDRSTLEATRVFKLMMSKQAFAIVNIAGWVQSFFFGALITYKINVANPRVPHRIDAISRLRLYASTPGSPTAAR